MSIPLIPSLAINIDNPGRGGAFAPFLSVANMADTIHISGWLPTSVIITDGTEETLMDTTETLLSLLEAYKGDKEASKVSVTVAGTKYDYATLKEALNAYAIEATGQLGKCVAIGNTRTLALHLLAALGHSVEGVRVESVEADNVSELAIRDNVAHQYATKLDAIQRLATIVDLANAGKVGKEADIAKLGHKRGMSQTLYLQLEAVNAGLPLVQASRLKATKEARAALASSEPVPSLLELLKAGTTVTYKPVPAAKVADAAKLTNCPSLQALLAAIANGNEVELNKLVRRCPDAEWVPPVVPTDNKDKSEPITSPE